MVYSLFDMHGVRYMMYGTWHISIRSLHTTISGIPRYIGPESQNLKSLCVHAVYWAVRLEPQCQAWNKEGVALHSKDK